MTFGGEDFALLGHSNSRPLPQVDPGALVPVIAVYLYSAGCQNHVGMLAGGATIYIDAVWSDSNCASVLALYVDLGETSCGAKKK